MVGLRNQFHIVVRFIALLGSFALFLSGCSFLTPKTTITQAPYFYPGTSTIVASGGGTYTVSWHAVPPTTSEAVIYNLFMKQGTAADPEGAQVPFDYSAPYQQFKLGELSFVTPNLVFQYNTCFAVRLAARGYTDTNTAQVCTKHQRFAFGGVSSLGVQQGGIFALSWPAVPDSEVQFSLYTRKANASESYNFGADPLMKTSDTLVKTPAFPLNETRCFLVRFNSKVFSSDANTKEVCSGDDGVADFVGVDSVTSLISGQATVSWVKSVNPNVTGYRIYQGSDFRLNSGVAQPSANSLVVTGLPPGEQRAFGVRAFDRNGREDNNTKTIPVTISDAQTVRGDFLGCTGNSVIDSSRIRINFTWPVGASRMAVVRDGVVVYDTGNTTDTSFTDVGLSNARSYNYKCNATVNGLSTEGTASYHLQPLNQSDLPSFPGCSLATALNENQIQLTFAWPSFTGRTVSAMNLYRSGVLVRSETSNVVTTYTDSGLSEAQTVIYSCKAVVDGFEVAGSSVLTAQTLSVNPPSFAGLATAVAYGVSGAKLTWLPAASGGAPVARYEVWGNPGTTLVTSGSPLQTLSASALQATLSNLGEELPYIYGIRACSANDLCSWGLYNSTAVLAVNSTNSTSVTKSYTRSDTGNPPNTVGAASATMSGGAAQISAPWSAAQGAVKNRHVYYRNVTDSVPAADAATCTSNIKAATCYPNERVIAVTDLANPPVTLSVDGLNDGKSYAFIVRDEDPAGNYSQNMVVITLSTGDLTPPTFGGGGTLALGTPTETTLRLTFAAIAPEVLTPTNNQGASHYLVYLSEADGANTPADPCVSGTLLSPQIDASLYTAAQSVSFDISGRTARKTYAVCVKARDSSGNMSVTTTRATPLITTPDTTAPAFFDIQSLAYNSEQSCISLGWNESANVDLKEYKATLWKDSVPATKVSKIIAKPASSVCLSLSTDLGGLGSLNNETVWAYVQACDTAAPPFGTQNCSANNEAGALSRFIPDTVAPANFGGITAVSASSPAINGAVTVTWQGPTDNNWSDYRGFKVYDVPCKRDASACGTPTSAQLNLLKDCACTASGCAEHLTSCQVTGLNPYRRYTFLVRAYDATGNQTAIGTNPFVIERRSDDVEKPTFSSALTPQWVTTSNATCATAGNGACLGWNAAIDNQYAGDSNVISYKIYRKAGSAITFDGSHLPVTGGAEASLIATVATNTSYKDLASGLTGGTTYYYAVCAVDAATTAGSAGNAGASCDELVVNLTPPDLVLPTVFNATISNATPTIANPTWTLSWQFSDNLTNNVVWKVYRTDTAPTATTYPDGTGTPLFQNNVSATGGINYSASIAAETGVSGEDRRIAYLITATDNQGNIGSATIAVNADLSTPTMPTIAGAEGEVVTNFAKQYTGTCDSTAGNTTTAAITPSGTGGIHSVTCISDLLTVRAHFSEGSGDRILTVTTTKLNGNTVSASHQLYFHKPCPTGYVGVPGKWSTDTDITGLGNVNAIANHPTDAGLDPTNDFCVMKYPAKLATSNNGGQTAWDPVEDGFKTLTMVNYWPESRANGTPWTYVARDQSIDRCKALNEAFGLCSGAGCYTAFDNSTFGYRLMSNTEWQVAARNLEKNPVNWSGNAVGSGVLNRGHSDGAVDANAALHSQYFAAGGLLLSHPRWDLGYGYFGTGNAITQVWNTLGASPAVGTEQKRTHTLSTGSQIWDIGGNLHQWVADNNKDGLGGAGLPNVGNLTQGDMGLSVTARAGGAWWDYTNAGLTASDRLLFGSIGNYPSTQNGGQLYGASTGAVLRGGHWNGPNLGAFGTVLNNTSANVASFYGFRCAFLSPPLTGSDTGAPQVSFVQRIDVAGTGISNTPVTISAGGFWNLGWNVSDAENTGVNANRIWVQVRRKASTFSNDYPTLADPVYREGFYLTSLNSETAWDLNSSFQYTVSDGKYLNYLITAIDPAGNMSSSAGATFAVQVTKSCPPGFVGVPGNNVTKLGNVNAIAGNPNKQLDPSLDFCVMKYQAKAMSANTTIADTTVGGKLEPLADGNKAFTNDYTYSNYATFNTKVTYLPESRYEGTPWVNLSRDNSINACRALQMAYLNTMPDLTTGTGFQLISNTQWQIVARNAEANPVNWSGNAVGTGVLNRGHSDGVVDATSVVNSQCFGCTEPSTGQISLANSRSDANGYYGTGNTAGAAWNTLGLTPAVGTEQKRTHTLSNGITVWDFSGNVWQWIADNNKDGSGEAGLPGALLTEGDMGASGALRAAVAWWDYDSTSLTVDDKLLFGGAGGYTFTKNAGRLYGPTGAMYRGNNWTATTLGGLFGGHGGASASVSPGSHVGFRCAYVP